LTSKKPLVDITLPAAVFNSVPGIGVTAPAGEKLLAADSKSYKKFILAVAP
jgi:hypothetical protein